MAADFHRNARPRGIIAQYERRAKAKGRALSGTAAQLREMAATAPTGSDLKDKLLDLASQYDRFAERAFR